MRHGASEQRMLVDGSVGLRLITYIHAGAGRAVRMMRARILYSYTYRALYT